MSLPNTIDRITRHRTLFAILSGVLMALAFPTRPDHALAFVFGAPWAFVALIPLFVTLVSCSRRQGWRLGWWAGFTFNLIGLYWVAFTQGGGPAVIAGTVCMAAYLGLFWGAFTLLLVAMAQRWGPRSLAAAPVLWTASEYALSLGELGFPWLLLGHSQGCYPAAIQYAEFTGVYGISFWIVVVNVLLYQFVSALGSDVSRRWAIVALVAVCAPILYGWTVLENSPSVDHPRQGDESATRVGEVRVGGVRVGLVQNNLGLAKWSPGGLEKSFESLERLSRSVVASQPQQPDLIVWPETALPCYLSLRPQCSRRVQNLVATLGTPILTGASNVEPSTGEPYNAAFLIRDASSPPVAYAKMHLVPFGERTPFRDSFAFLRDIDWTALTGDLGPAEFARGRERTTFELPASGATFAALICFESVFPDFVRNSVAEGAEFLVNITNDSWFGRTAGPYQHAQLTVMRAVENRRAIARCATSGISLFVDPYGRTFDRTPIFAEAVVSRELPRSRLLTFYTRHGDWFAQLSTAMVVVFAFLLVAGGRNKLLPGAGEAMRNSEDS